jgi:hypothetical protein
MEIRALRTVTYQDETHVQIGVPLSQQMERSDQIRMALLKGQAPHAQQHSRVIRDRELFSKGCDLLARNTFEGANRHMLDVNSIRRNASRLQLVSEGAADSDHTVGLPERPSIQLIVQLHFHVLCGVPVVERDPLRRAIESSKAHQKMRLYSIGPNYMRLARFHQSL